MAVRGAKLLTAAICVVLGAPWIGCTAEDPVKVVLTAVGDQPVPLPLSGFRWEDGCPPPQWNGALQAVRRQILASGAGERHQHARALLLLLSLPGPADTAEAIRLLEDVTRQVPDHAALQHLAAAHFHNFRHNGEAASLFYAFSSALRAEQSGSPDVAPLLTLVVAELIPEQQGDGRNLNQRTRLHLEDELLPEWGLAQEGRPERAAALLREASADLEVLDLPILRETLRQAASASHDPQDLLADGLALYGLARQYHELQVYHRAFALFGAARTQLIRAGSPFAFWPGYYQAVIVQHDLDYDSALVRFQALRAEAARDRSATAYLDWMVAETLLRAADTGPALRFAQRARESFLALGEAENQAAMDTEIALILHRMGDHRRALVHDLAALRTLPWMDKPRRRQNTLSSVAAGLSDSGHLEAAYVFQRASFEEAERSYNPLSLVLGGTRVAKLLHRLGRHAEAEFEIERAGRAVEWIPFEGLRRDSRALLTLTRAGLLMDSDPRQALALLRSVAPVFEHNDIQHLVGLRVLESEAWRRLGDDSEALRGLDRGMKEVERRAAGASNLGQRWSHLDRARSLRDARLRFQIERGDLEGAFLGVERYNLQYTPRLAASPPDTVESLRRRLPEAVGVVTAAIFDDQTYLWLLRRDGMTPISVAAGAREIAQQVKCWLDAPTSPEGKDCRGWLSERLIDPMASHLTRLDHLLVVAEGSLHQLPFEALHLPDGRPVIESLGVAYVPSVTDYLDFVPTPPLRLADSTALFVGDIEYPESARREWSALEPSPLRQVLRGIFPLVRELTGSAASKPRILEELGRSDVVYVETHALSRHDGLTALMLAGEGDSLEALLTPAEIDPPSPLRTRLVLLAACRTSGGAEIHGSTSDLPLQLVRAGAATVIGTRRAVRQREVWDFHDALLTQKNISKPGVFFRLQRALLASQSVPEALDWTTYKLYGGPI